MEEENEADLGIMFMDQGGVGSRGFSDSTFDQGESRNIAIVAAGCR